MRYLEVGGLRVSRVGIGTWQFGSKLWGYGQEYSERTAREIIQRALELGVNFIDSAEIYGMGESERIVGGAIEADRDPCVIATKMFPVFPIPPVVVSRGYASAQRLGVKKIDLYQIHFHNPLVPLSLQMSGMRTLIERKLVANVGVSNFSLVQWIAAERHLRSPVVSNQVHFSLLNQSPRINMTTWAAANDRLIIAYSPLEQGLLTGKYDEKSKLRGMRSRTRSFSRKNRVRIIPLLTLMRQVANSHGATVSQIALAWLIHMPNVIVIPGASSVSQLELNVEATNISLSEDEFVSLCEAGLKATS